MSTTDMNRSYIERMLFLLICSVTAIMCAMVLSYNPQINYALSENDVNNFMVLWSLAFYVVIFLINTILIIILFPMLDYISE